MRSHDLYVVITGDIVSSSKFEAKQRERLLSVLKSSFRTIRDIWPDIIFAPFEIKLLYKALCRKILKEEENKVDFSYQGFLPHGLYNVGNGEFLGKLQGLTLIMALRFQSRE